MILPKRQWPEIAKSRAISASAGWRRSRSESGAEVCPHPRRSTTQRSTALWDRELHPWVPPDGPTGGDAEITWDDTAEVTSPVEASKGSKAHTHRGDPAITTQNVGLSLPPSAAAAGPTGRTVEARPHRSTARRQRQTCSAVGPLSPYRGITGDNDSLGGPPTPPPLGAQLQVQQVEFLFQHIDLDSEQLEHRVPLRVQKEKPLVHPIRRA